MSNLEMVGIYAALQPESPPAVGLTIVHIYLTKRHKSSILHIYAR